MSRTCLLQPNSTQAQMLYLSLHHVQYKYYIVTEIERVVITNVTYILAASLIASLHVMSCS